MYNLNDDLDLLYELDALRNRAKELREGGLLALKGIKEIDINGKIIPTETDQNKSYEKWITSANDVEAALLVKVQNHKDISDSDSQNDEAQASRELKERLKEIKLRSLFPSIHKTFEALPGNGRDDKGEYITLKVYKERLDDQDESKTAEVAGDLMRTTDKFIEGLDVTVPVLIAARTMQALVRRAQSVFHRATMVCYYRIVRELYVAVGPDWIIGAARANAGGTASAFVTSECIRAILAFENAVKRTVDFFKQTRELWERHDQLKIMLDGIGVQPGTSHPLSKWADKAIRRMWLDWYISTNPRRGEMAVYFDPPNNQIPPTPLNEIDMKFVDLYLKALPVNLRTFVDKAREQMERAKTEIDELRKEQNPYEQTGTQTEGEEKRFKKGRDKEDERVYQQTESAHQVAFRAVKRGISETDHSEAVLEENQDHLVTILDLFISQFEDISRSIHRILEPAKQYVRNVVNRELANAETGRFDAGELAFAAASYGATTDWKQNERLERACALLIRSLPDSGSLPTKRPFHSTPRGYRLLPIGCEMTRSFAQLLQKTNYEFEPQMVRKMLNIFEDKEISLSVSTQDKKRFGWNFEGAPSPGRACVWVTAVAVLALDRIVRMLNERVNTIVLKHFEVITPEKPHTEMTLNHLIYSDYGFTEYFSREPSLAIRLEQMRAHVIRATLPEWYRPDSHRYGRVKSNQKVFSVILYGPPGTGKTTLVESLAFSSHVPLVRLSPSDLTVHGQELIEGRARAVFEALSMLTQAVIILDEFEPVLDSRNPEGKGEDSSDPVFNFLLTGMLPKLAKLNEAAGKQSLVYCLATNFMERIDKAARRIGRFDFKIPVYHPDPLSRAGTFLYRLNRYATSCGGENINLRKDELSKKKLLEVVSDTAYLPAGELAKHYFKTDKDSPWFEYYLKEGAEKYPVGDKDKLTIPEGLSPEEVDQRDRLTKWEDKIENAIGDNHDPTGVTDILSYCLTPD